MPYPPGFKMPVISGTPLVLTVYPFSKYVDGKAQYRKHGSFDYTVYQDTYQPVDNLNPLNKQLWNDIQAKGYAIGFGNTMDLTESHIVINSIAIDELKLTGRVLELVPTNLDLLYSFDEGEEPMTLRKLAARLGLSRNILSRRLREVKLGTSGKVIDDMMITAVRYVPSSLRKFVVSNPSK